MLIVTGVPRSGTSWVMQTLFYLRYPVFGIPNPPNRDPLIQPDGKPFWEFPQTLAGDLSILGNSECAVKVDLRKAIQYVVLNPATDKVIFCNRDTTISAQSQLDAGIGLSLERNIKVINQWKQKALAWVGETPYLVGDIDWAINNKITAINAIKNFIGSTQDITDAVENMV